MLNEQILSYRVLDYQTSQFVEMKTVGRSGELVFRISLPTVSSIPVSQSFGQKACVFLQV